MSTVYTQVRAHTEGLSVFTATTLPSFHELARKRDMKGVPKGLSFHNTSVAAAAALLYLFKCFLLMSSTTALNI